jgi:hypothetical protein
VSRRARKVDINYNPRDASGSFFHSEPHMRRNENNKLRGSVVSRHLATAATKFNRTVYNIWQFMSETKRNL